MEGGKTRRPRANQQNTSWRNKHSLRNDVASVLLRIRRAERRSSMRLLLSKASRAGNPHTRPPAGGFFMRSTPRYPALSSSVLCFVGGVLCGSSERSPQTCFVCAGLSADYRSSSAYLVRNTWSLGVLDKVHVSQPRRLRAPWFVAKPFLSCLLCHGFSFQYAQTTAAWV